LNYASNEVVSIALTIRFDNALQTPLGTGVGTFVGRGDTGVVSTTSTGSLNVG
jgi:hypothetical protein